MPCLRVSLRRASLALALVAGTALAVRAQQSQSTPPPTPPPSPVICRVENRPITQRDYDQLALPYFERLRVQLGPGYTEDIQKFAKRNALDELIRREVVAIVALREKITVSEDDTDRLLRGDPFFQTNGKFDPGKFLQYKVNPGSNYLAVLPRLRELAAAAKLDSVIRARSTPSAAAVRAEWSKRNEQVHFQFLSLALRDMSLDPEATEAELSAYYAAHNDQFIRKPRVRLRYLRLRLPPQGDSLRASAETEAMKRGRGIADSLKTGFPIDTLANPLGGAGDTGPFDVPPTVIPGLGRVPELVTALEHADTDTTVRVLGPVVAGDWVTVALVAERHPQTLPPMNEVIGDVKRRADAEKRKEHEDEAKRDWYEAHRDLFRTERARVTRVMLDPAAVQPRDPSPADLVRWYAQNAHQLMNPEDSAAVVPALNDSLRGVIRERMLAEARATAVSKGIATVAAGWRTGRDPRPLARTAGATVETLTVYRDSLADAIFPRDVLDSLFISRASAPQGGVEGPREFGERSVLWRVDALDTSYVRSFDSARPRVEQSYAQERRMADDADGKAHFEAHRTDYKTKPKYVIDYIAVRIPPADSVRVPAADIRKFYDTHQDAYRREEEVHARHILLALSPNGPDEARVRARADSLRRAILAGANFEDLARTFSEDPGSAPSGGDLGFFARNRMVKEFADTSFALAVGQVSQPVRTQFGFHLIKVEERRPAGVQPLADVEQDIRRQLAQARGDSTAMRTANTLRRRIAAGADAKVLSGKHGGIATAGPFAATDPVPIIGFVQALSQEIDKLPVGKWAPKVYRTPIAYVVLRPTRRVPSAQAEYDEVKAQATEDAKTVKRREILAGKVEKLRGQLAAGASLDSVSAIYGGLKDSGPLVQATGFVPYLGAEPRIVTRAFAMKQGAVSDTIQTASGVVWIRVGERSTAQGASFAKDRETLTGELTMKKYNEWLEEKKKTVHIEYLRADLREVPSLTKTVTISGGGQ